MKWRTLRVPTFALMLLFVVSLPISAKTLTVSGILAWFGGDSITAGAQRFLEAHPDVEIVFQGAGPQDVIVSIVGGAPPDIVGLPAGALPSWAVQGLVLPVDQYAARDSVREADFIPPAWRDVTYDGRLWGLPLIVDPVYGLLRNKALFAESGLDPDAPPATVQDLDSVFPKLNRYNNEGRIEQLAMNHWPIQGDGNTLYTWGFAFGGEFVDYETGAITAHDPGNVAALEWLLDYYNRYNDELLDLQTLDGQDSIAIPVGVSDPDLAWELMRTIAATEEGAAAFSRAQSWFTAYIPSPYWQEAMSDPIIAPYIDITLNARNTRARIPANEFYAQQIMEAMADLYERRAFSAREALERVSQRVEEEMARMLGRQ